MSALTISARDGAARTGTVMTRRGAFRVPAFMPVGTHATVKALHPAEVRECGADILLCNAYHLMLRPGLEVVTGAGGLHSFMGWDGPILTDSGGYQLVTLSAAVAVSDEGAMFISPYDGSRMFVTPEDAVQAQAQLGADILMCLDHPVAWGTDDGIAREATERTHRWAERCRRAHPGNGSLLFGIVQGGFNADARRESAARIAQFAFDGNAVGGLSVGEPLDVMLEMTALAVEQLPEDRPRYFMGLGTDEEIVRMVGVGIDMFDCVAPTRLARNGTAITSDGHLNLRNAQYRHDTRPIDAGCGCTCCRDFSRAYLRHLFQAREILAHRMLSVHNLTHLARLMESIRTAIGAGRMAELQAAVEARQSGGLSPAAG